MRVSIDQTKCTGSGMCESTVPEVFILLDDGVAYVKEGDSPLNDPGGREQSALVPEDLEEAVADASDACPGGCIYLVE